MAGWYLFFVPQSLQVTKGFIYGLFQSLLIFDGVRLIADFIYDKKGGTLLK